MKNTSAKEKILFILVPVFFLISALIKLDIISLNVSDTWKILIEGGFYLFP